nr:hypothetical protein [Tanacetum cinerariifolium]
SQVLGDINSPVQTRRQVKHTEEPTIVAQALADPEWVEAMQTEMQQFRNQKSEFEMSSMGPFTFFLGLQVDQRPDGIFIHQEKEKNVPDEPISVHFYRSMIGCLMYLTATRPDIMFAVCAAARHQRFLLLATNSACGLDSAGSVDSAGRLTSAATSVSAGFSVSAASSIPAATPIAAGISTTAGASGSAKTEAGDIMYMFVDKKYPLTPATLKRILNHGLEIDRDPFGNDLTTAIQFIQSF